MVPDGYRVYRMSDNQWMWFPPDVTPPPGVVEEVDADVFRAERFGWFENGPGSGWRGSGPAVVDVVGFAPVSSRSIDPPGHNHSG